jgi:hypothetical protein
MNKQELLEEIVKLDIEASENFPHYDLVDKEVVLTLINQLEELEKVVIPHFVADWIDAHNLYGNNPLREYRDLENDFNEGWTNEKDAAVYHWVNKNPYAFIDALRYGYEVEKEKLYRVRAGSRYVRFNLDGSIIGVKKDNSIVCLERLSKLPFDYKKAVESGIITLEEVTE